MHYYPEDDSPDNLKKLMRQNVCAVCGRQVVVYLDFTDKRKYIACSGGEHEGITREYQPPIEDYRSNIRREIEMEQKVGTQVARTVGDIPKQGQLTQPQAERILSLVYPDCPKDEVIRCAILCRDFGLHPLMKEVYLIPFKDKDGKANYATVLGINATRKLMAQRGTYSYIDDTPRLMTDEEQMRIFGEVDKANIVAITKLRTKDGLEAPGYGRWPKEKQPYGTDKGNTKANMAFIRSERNAFGRLSPDALPPDVEIIDEAYAKLPEIKSSVDLETGEITEEEQPVEAEFAEVSEEKTEEKPEEKSGSPVDMPWLIDSVNKLKWDILQYIKDTYKVKTSGNLGDVVDRLSKEQQAELCKEVQDRLNMK